MDPAQKVNYVGDGGKVHYALVKKDHGGGTLDLIVFDDDGASSVKTSVPRRAQQDYGPEGGGHTWH